MFNNKEFRVVSECESGFEKALASFSMGNAVVFVIDTDIEKVGFIDGKNQEINLFTRKYVDLSYDAVLMGNHLLRDYNSNMQSLIIVINENVTIFGLDNKLINDHMLIPINKSIAFIDFNNNTNLHCIYDGKSYQLTDKQSQTVRDLFKKSQEQTESDIEGSDDV